MNLPTWVPERKGCGNHPRESVFAMVMRACEVVRGMPPDPQRCGTNAKPVLALWRALSMPPPVEFSADLALVIEWAQRSNDPAARNDIRGLRPNGEQWGTDRSRDMATLCVQDRWDARLEAARRWHAGSTGAASGGPPAAPVAPPTSDADRAWEQACALIRAATPGQPLPPAADAFEARTRAAIRAMPNGWARIRGRDQFTTTTVRKDFTARWLETAGQQEAR